MVLYYIINLINKQDINFLRTVKNKKYSKVYRKITIRRILNNDDNWLWKKDIVNVREISHGANRIPAYLKKKNLIMIVNSYEKMQRYNLFFYIFIYIWYNNDMCRIKRCFNV